MATAGLGEVGLVSSGPNKTIQDVTIETTANIIKPMTIHFVNFPET
jgi:hypothetical protein